MGVYYIEAMSLPIKSPYKQVFIVFSIIIITGTALLCSLFSMSSMDNIASNHAEVTLHILHAKELTITTTTLIYPSSIILILLALSLVVLSFFQRIRKFLQLNIPSYSKWKYWSNLYITQPAIRSWLSLFEISPNLIKLT